MDALATSIRQNMARVNENITLAAQTSGRRLEDIRVVVVTKSQPVEVVRAAFEAGARVLGENYPEESLAKIQALNRVNDVAWHMIGHLQSRKASIVTGHFDMLESLDSLRLAEKLERLLSDQQRILPVLIEMNVSGEESKYGMPGWDEAHWEQLLPEIEQILALPHLSVRGLMTMPPLYDDPEQPRPFFARLRRLGEFLSERCGRENFRELSMGTSSDYATAVEEGATFVRIGTAIVGPRIKKPDESL